MKSLYVVIDRDEERELVYKPTERTVLLEAFAATGAIPTWTFMHGEYDITVYAGALEVLPVGDNRDEMELRAVAALRLT